MVSPLSNVQITFDNVVQSGITSADLGVLDPGERTTPCGNVIPSYAQPPGTDDHFEVYRIETTALHTDSILVQIDHPADDTRLLRAKCWPGERFEFKDTTTLAIPGDPRGRIPKFSEFVVVRDTRNPELVTGVKLADLRAILDTGSPAAMNMDDEFLRPLRDAARAIFGAVAAVDCEAALSEIASLKGFVRENSGEGIPNTDTSPAGNVAGQLLSVASTLQFTVSLDCVVEECECVCD
jgi:hypothetical protein